MGGENQDDEERDVACTLRSSTLGRLAPEGEMEALLECLGVGDFNAMRFCAAANDYADQDSRSLVGNLLDGLGEASDASLRSHQLRAQASHVLGRVVGAAGVEARELKRVLRCLREPSHLSVPLLTALERMASPAELADTGASAKLSNHGSVSPKSGSSLHKFFLLGGERAGLRIPLREWPFPWAYQIGMWLLVESFPGSQPAATTNRAHILRLAASTGPEAFGVDYYLEDSQLCVAVSDAQAKAVTYLDVTLQRRRWYRLVFHHQRAGLFGQDELRVYLDGKPVFERPLPLLYPRGLGSLQDCVVAGGLEGAVGAVLLYSQPQDVDVLHATLDSLASCVHSRENTLDGAVACPSERRILATEPDLPAAQERLSKTEKLRSKLLGTGEAKLLASYLPNRCWEEVESDDRNGSSGGGERHGQKPCQPRRRRRRRRLAVDVHSGLHAEMIGATYAWTVRRACNVVASIGGVSVLLPMISRLFVAPSPGRAEPPPLALLLSVLAAFLEGSATNKHELLRVGGIAILESIIASAPVAALQGQGAAAAYAVERLCAACKLAAPAQAVGAKLPVAPAATELYGQAVTRLFVNFRLWAAGPRALQFTLAARVLEAVRRDQPVFRSLLQLSDLLDVVRDCFLDRSPTPVAGSAPGLAERRHMRACVMLIVRVLLSNSVSTEEMVNLLQFVVTCSEDAAVADVVSVLDALLRQPVPPVGLFQAIEEVTGDVVPPSPAAAATEAVDAADVSDSPTRGVAPFLLLLIRRCVDVDASGESLRAAGLRAVAAYAARVTSHGSGAGGKANGESARSAAGSSDPALAAHDNGGMQRVLASFVPLLFEMLLQRRHDLAGPTYAALFEMALLADEAIVPWEEQTRRLNLELLTPSTTKQAAVATAIAESWGAGANSPRPPSPSGYAFGGRRAIPATDSWDLPSENSHRGGNGLVSTASWPHAADDSQRVRNTIVLALLLRLLPSMPEAVRLRAHADLLLLLKFNEENRRSVLALASTHGESFRGTWHRCLFLMIAPLFVQQREREGSGSSGGAGDACTSGWKALENGRAASSGAPLTAKSVGGKDKAQQQQQLAVTPLVVAADGTEAAGEADYLMMLRLYASLLLHVMHSDDEGYRELELACCLRRLTTHGHSVVLALLAELAQLLGQELAPARSPRRPSEPRAPSLPAHEMEAPFSMAIAPGGWTEPMPPASSPRMPQLLSVPQLLWDNVAHLMFLGGAAISEKVSTAMLGLLQHSNGAKSTSSGSPAAKVSPRNQNGLKSPKNGKKAALDNGFHLTGAGSGGALAALDSGSDASGSASGSWRSDEAAMVALAAGLLRLFDALAPQERQVRALVATRRDQIPEQGPLLHPLLRMSFYLLAKLQKCDPAGKEMKDATARLLRLVRCLVPERDNNGSGSANSEEDYWLLACVVHAQTALRALWLYAASMAEDRPSACAGGSAAAADVGSEAAAWLLEACEHLSGVLVVALAARQDMLLKRLGARLVGQLAAALAAKGSDAVCGDDQPASWPAAAQKLKWIGASAVLVPPLSRRPSAGRLSLLGSGSNGTSSASAADTLEDACLDALQSLEALEDRAVRSAVERSEMRWAEFNNAEKATVAGGGRGAVVAAASAAGIAGERRPSSEAASAVAGTAYLVETLHRHAAEARAAAADRRDRQAHAAARRWVRCRRVFRAPWSPWSVPGDNWKISRHKDRSMRQNLLVRDYYPADYNAASREAESAPSSPRKRTAVDVVVAAALRLRERRTLTQGSDAWESTEGTEPEGDEDEEVLLREIDKQVASRADKYSGQTVSNPTSPLPSLNGALSSGAVTPVIEEETLGMTTEDEEAVLANLPSPASTATSPGAVFSSVVGGKSGYLATKHPGLVPPPLLLQQRHLRATTAPAAWWRVTMVLPQTLIEGNLVLLQRNLLFQATADGREMGSVPSDPVPAAASLAESDSDHGGDVRSRPAFFRPCGHTKSWRLNRLTHVHLRRFLLQPGVAVELFWLDRHEVFFWFNGREERRRFTDQLLKRPLPMLSRLSRRLMPPRKLLRASKLTELWCRREISNFDYLMQLNVIAGRTYNDVNQYPVLPWVLTDYVSKQLDLKGRGAFRDLAKPMGALDPLRLQNARRKYEELQEHEPDMPPYLYGSLYSHSGSVLHYLVRQEPYTRMHVRLQSGSFDLPNRMFFDVARAWDACSKGPGVEVRELVPEFFCLPEAFLNTNHLPMGQLEDNEGAVDDVRLPPWANGSAHRFVRLMRRALESERVSERLHLWIDLVFGARQHDLRANNVFRHQSYEGKVDLSAFDGAQRTAVEHMIMLWGQVPSRLVTELHPPRLSREECSVVPCFAYAAEPPKLALYVPQRQGAKGTGAVLALAAAGDRVVAVYEDFSVAAYAFGKEPDGNGLPFTFGLQRPRKVLSSRILAAIGDKCMWKFGEDNVETSKKEQQYSIAATAVSGGRAGLLSRRTIGNWNFGAWFGPLNSGSSSAGSGGGGGGASNGGSNHASSKVGHDWLLSCGYWNNTVRAHSLDSSLSEQCSVAGGHYGAINCIAVGDHAPLVVTGGADATCRVWVVDSPAVAAAMGGGSAAAAAETAAEAVPLREDEQPPVMACVHVLWGHEAPVTCLALSVDLDLVVSGAQDGRIVMHLVAGGRFVRQYFFDEAAAAAASASSPDAAPPGPEASVVALSSNGDVVVHSWSDMSLHLFSLNGARLASVDAGARITCMQTTNDGELLLTGDVTGAVTMRWLEDLSVRRRLDLSGHGGVTCLRLCPDDQHLLVGSDDGKITVCTDTRTRLDLLDIAFSKAFVG